MEPFYAKSRYLVNGQLLRHKPRKEFSRNFKRGKLDEDFKYKYRDTFLYEWAAGRVEKPVDYLILIALDSLTVTELGTRTVELQRILPLQ